MKPNGIYDHKQVQQALALDGAVDLLRVDGQGRDVVSIMIADGPEERPSRRVVLPRGQGQ